MLLTHEITTRHLTPHQCGVLKTLVGRRCEIRGAALMQVCEADGGTWVERGHGVICLVKDHPGKQYIFKALNLKKKEEILSHRITSKFKYIVNSDRFHYMTGSKGSMTGLNFVDEAEAAMFKEAVDRKKQKWKLPSNSSHPRGLPEHMPAQVSLEDVRSYLPSHLPTVGNHTITPKSVDWNKDSPLMQIKHEILDT